MRTNPLSNAALICALSLVVSACSITLPNGEGNPFSAGTITSVPSSGTPTTPNNPVTTGSSETTPTTNTNTNDSSPSSLSEAASGPMAPGPSLNGGGYGGSRGSGSPKSTRPYWLLIENITVPESPTMTVNGNPCKAIQIRSSSSMRCDLALEPSEANAEIFLIEIFNEKGSLVDTYEFLNPF